MMMFLIGLELELLDLLQHLLCIVRRLRFLVGAVELKRLVLLQLSRSCSWLLLPTLYSL